MDIFFVHSPHGTFTVDITTGTVVGYTSTLPKEQGEVSYTTIHTFDIYEYTPFVGRPIQAGESLVKDDIGCWLRDGSYLAPRWSYRLSYHSERAVIEYFAESVSGRFCVDLDLQSTFHDVVVATQEQLEDLGVTIEVPPLLIKRIALSGIYQFLKHHAS